VHISNQELNKSYMAGDLQSEVTTVADVVEVGQMTQLSCVVSKY